MKKVLIGYATAGVGHKKASLAVKEAFNEMQGVEVKTIDVLDYTNPFFKKAYPNGYLFLIGHLIYFWGFLYYFFDIKLVHRLSAGLRVLYHVMNSGPLVKFLIEYKPDVVISTHFLLPDVCNYVEKKYGFRTEVINVVTDYRAHSFWIAEGVDRYCVADRETFNDLTVKWGVSPDMVNITGIPVEPKFTAPHDKAVFRKKIGIPEHNFTILLLSGGYGVGPVLELVKALDKLRENMTLIVICGHNAGLYENVEAFRKTASSQVINFKYVDNVDELMSCSDVYVGKAGGISTSEAICIGVPLIYIRPIPGQESRNARYVSDNGAGITVKSVIQVAEVVKGLMEDPAKLKVMSDNIRKLYKKDSASAVAGLAVKLADGSAR